MPTIYDWSTTAGNNATADANINWSEGQFPSTVNDSARQMMGRQAEWLKDNGVLTAAGTANAITVTANSQVTTPPHGMTIAFRATAANTAAVTLSVNGGAGLPLRKPKPGSSTVADLEAGDILQGGVFVVHYDSSANAGVGAWVLINPTSNQAAIGAAISAATAKTTPADGDFLAGIVADTPTLFKSTWANIKSALQAFFDGRFVRLDEDLQFVPSRKIFNRGSAGGNIGSNTVGAIEIQPNDGVNNDAFMSFHVPSVAKRFNLGLRPGEANLFDALHIGGGTLGATSRMIYNTSHFELSGNGDLILAGGTSYNVYTGAALLYAINTQANTYASTKTAPQECNWNTGISEFGTVDIGFGNVTADLPAPWVMVGLRSRSGSNQVNIRGVKLRNFT